MIIDCHGHYTTAPAGHDAWREAQKAAFKAGTAAPLYPTFSDDEIRETLEQNQLRLLRDTLHVLMEGVPSAVGFSEIGNALAALPGVVAVHDLHVWGITPESVSLSAHMEIEKLEDWPGILARSRRLLHDRFGIDHVTLQPEAVGTGIPREAVVQLWPRGRRPRR